MFLSTIFNITIISNFENIFKVKNIEIVGLTRNEQINIKNDLKIFENKNIFRIKKKEIIQILNEFNFINYFTINKKFPSKIIIFVKKTDLLGATFFKGEKLYIGNNGKFINVFDLDNIKGLPIIFGKFPIKDYLKLQKKLNSQNFNLSNIEKYFYFQSKRWDIEFKDGIKLKLPYKNIENSLKIFKSLKENNKIDSRSIVDLRLSNRIILSDGQK